MSLSFKQFYTRVQNYIGDNSTTTLTIIKETTNLKARELLRKGFFPWLLREKTLTLTSGTTDYVLPYDFGKPISIRQTDTPVQLREIWAGTFDRLLPDPSDSSGDPTHFMVVYQNKVLAQPTTSNKVAVKSTSAQDIAAQDGAAYATVYGSVSNVDRSEVLTLSATNIVCSTLSYDKLYAIGTDDEPTGTLYFTQVVVGTELLLLYPNAVSFDYKTIRFYPTPNQANSIYLKYQAMQPWLVNDSDLFIIPSEYLDVLFHMVTADMLAKQGDSKASYHEQKAMAGIDDMKKDVDMSWNYTPTIRYGDEGIVDNDYPFVNG